MVEVNNGISIDLFSLPSIIDGLNSDIRKKTEAAAALAIVSATIMLFETLMILRRFSKNSLNTGVLGRTISYLVANIINYFS